MKYLILVALFAMAAAQREYPEFDRTCAERSALIRPNVKTAFNVAAYSGTWFEIGRYQQRNEAEADCVSSSYSWGFISRQFRIARSGHDFVGNATFDRVANASLAFPDVSPTLGLLNVTYYGDRELEEPVTNYYVIATDYFQYALGWGCEELEDNRSREFAWVLSRTPELPEDYDERVSAYIDLYLDRAFIRDTQQSEEFCLDRALPGRQDRTENFF